MTRVPGARLLIVADDFGFAPRDLPGDPHRPRAGHSHQHDGPGGGPGLRRPRRGAHDSGLAVGAHLSRWVRTRVLSAAEVPTLVDDRGRFPLVTWEAAPSHPGRPGSGRHRRPPTASRRPVRGAPRCRPVAHARGCPPEPPPLAPGRRGGGDRPGPGEGIRALRVTRTSSWWDPVSLGVRALSADTSSGGRSGRAWPSPPAGPPSTRPADWTPTWPRRWPASGVAALPV